MSRLSNPLRRQLLTATAALSMLGASRAFADTTAALAGVFNQTDALKAIRSALQIGSQAAIKNLGQTNGFLNNQQVRIGLPPKLQQLETLMRLSGRGAVVDQLMENMNHAAEKAVPQAGRLVSQAIANMTVSDANTIVKGGETSVTNFFADKTRAALYQSFLPVVRQTTSKMALSGQYNQLASQVSQFGLLKPEEANVESYVTNKALDGLYLMIGEEEKKIRQNPIGTGSAILQKVFGR